MLKMRVGHTPTHKWLKTDLALLRWLRASKLNVGAAETAFNENIKWRTDNDMDSILQEDWSYWIREYYFDCSATDYDGRPVCTGDISEWDLRQAIVSGKGDKLLRYMIKTVEEHPPVCEHLKRWGVSLFVRFLTAHETYYPYGTHKVIIINAAGVFHVVLNIVRPVLSKPMQESLYVFGTDKAEWRKELLSMVPENELAPHFGGTKII
ncbi:hypothetical protein Fcan01_01323 [Folsomia candida]|uniref:CRAL-TRIO domain-containing protein n=1 Tax=Folsomia candida TaxID=158441 RepID=A0A226EYK9_FOLCA|nr:hypothetical protein Fcan01_01323 [Folsomia candida]